MVVNFLKEILQSGSKRRASQGSRRPTFLPRLEPLEDRFLLSGLTSLGGTGKFTGRVRDILVRSDDPNTVWAAAATGGLWVSHDAAANWSRADDFLETLTFSSLEADPNNPNVMYAGSGEIFTFGVPEGASLRNEDRGAGIFKTTDGGGNVEPVAHDKELLLREPDRRAPD